MYKFALILKKINWNNGQKPLESFFSFFHDMKKTKLYYDSIVLLKISQNWKKYDVKNFVFNDGKKYISGSGCKSVFSFKDGSVSVKTEYGCENYIWNIS